MSKTGEAVAIEPEYIGIDFAATRFDVSRSTIYALERRGQLQFSKLGRKSLIRLADIRELIAGLPSRRK